MWGTNECKDCNKEWEKCIPTIEVSDLIDINPNIFNIKLKELKDKFKNCKILKAEDLDVLIDLIYSINNYNTNIKIDWDQVNTTQPDYIKNKPVDIYKTTSIGSNTNIDTLTEGTYKFYVVNSSINPTYDSDNKPLRGAILSWFLYPNTMKVFVTKLIDENNQEFFLQKIVNFYNGEVFQRNRKDGATWLKLTQ